MTIIAGTMRGMHRFLHSTLFAVALSLAMAAARADVAAIPGPLASTPDVALPLADQVVVNKSERKLYLMREGEVLRAYRIALGLDPVGHKQREGDFRTPEGEYRLVRRNPQSDYFLSIQISYPNDHDVARARRIGVSPGGAIMIHGLPNAPRKPLDYYVSNDWTDGCIAVTNSEMVEIWLMTPPDTPIKILP
jgi:murein L,D-transpeptidase YafK